MTEVVVLVVGVGGAVIGGAAFLGSLNRMKKLRIKLTGVQAELDAKKAQTADLDTRLKASMDKNAAQEASMVMLAPTVVTLPPAVIRSWLP